MNAGQWALVAVVIWMGGTMILGGIGALVVLRLTRIRSAERSPSWPTEQELARIIPASRRRGPVPVRGGWRPPPGA